MTNAPSSNRFTLLAMLGIFALALVGVGFLVLAVFLLARGSGGASPAASPTRFAAATQQVFVPTTTQSPPTATLAPTIAATPTNPPATTAAPSGPTATATAAHVVKIVSPANVRSGPGTNYPVVAGLNTGQTAPVVGRDSSAQWFAISVDSAPQGTGWVSSLVASYDGSTNDLPVVQASAPPPPQATAVPPTNPPPPPATAAPAGPTNTPGIPNTNGLQTQLWTMPATGSPNTNIFFHFKVVNVSSSTISGYGILAAHTDQGVTADSWHDPLQPGKVLDWTDHIKFPNTGTYQVYLGICYSSHDSCKTGGAPWTRLSNYITVTIQ